jgi:hypothetical protein
VIIIHALQHTQEAQMALTECHSGEDLFSNRTAQAASGQPTSTGQMVLWSLGRKEVTIGTVASQIGRQPFD